MKPIIGISACLLGEKVRYDGEHRLDHYLRYTAGRYVKWLPVCPEVEAGMPVPREPMVLDGKGGLVRLITVNTGIDHTERLNKWIKKKLKELHKLNLSGFVFKSRSPSCGLSVRIAKTGQKTSGLFAQAFKKAFPEIPVIENETLYDPEERRNFFERVLLFNEFKAIKTEKELKDFHSDHRLVFLSRGKEAYKCLNQVISSSVKDKKTLYLEAMNRILTLKARPEDEERAFRMSIKELKPHIDSKTEKYLLKTLKDFRKGRLSRAYIISVLRHYSELYGIEDLISEPFLFTTFLN